MNIPLFSLMADEIVHSFEVWTERVVGVDDSELRSIPRYLSMCSMPIPQELGQEKVIVFNLSCVRSWWNVVNSLPSIEIVVISRRLSCGGSPTCVIGIGMEIAIDVSPSIIETFNVCVIILLSSSNDQVVVPDGPSISQHDLIFFWIDLFHPNVFRVCVVLTDGIFGDAMHLEFYCSK